MNRREAHDLGLQIEKPSEELYRVLRKIHLSYSAELKLRELGMLAVDVPRLVECKSRRHFGPSNFGDLIRIDFGC